MFELRQKQDSASLAAQSDLEADINALTEARMKIRWELGAKSSHSRQCASLAEVCDADIHTTQAPCNAKLHGCVSRCSEEGADRPCHLFNPFNDVPCTLRPLKCDIMTPATHGQSDSEAIIELPLPSKMCTMEYKLASSKVAW